MFYGAVLSLIEPLSATEKMKTKGASKSLTSIIECESLFNDGVAVAIIVFAKGILKNSVGKNILLLVFKEIFGAIVVGMVISFVMFKILRSSNEPQIHVLISLLTVALVNIVCEAFGFSGVIASVVSGMYFSMQNKKVSRWKEVVDTKELYNDFWEVASSILGSILYVMAGLSILSVKLNIQILYLIPAVIVINLISRFIGARVGVALLGKTHLPSKYDAKEFTSLLTISALRGGVSLALAMTLKDILLPEIYNIVVSVVLITILFTTIIQGLLSGKVYEKIEANREKKYSERSLCVR